MANWQRGNSEIEWPFWATVRTGAVLNTRGAPRQETGARGEEQDVTSRATVKFPRRFCMGVPYSLAWGCHILGGAKSTLTPG